jgi:hypothetical protein
LPSELPRYATLLRSAREATRLSQGEFAKRLGVDRTSISNAENGRGTPGVFSRIGEVLSPEVSAEILAAWSETREVRSRRIRHTTSSKESTTPSRPLDGSWYAIWQTTAEGRPNFNTEQVSAAWAAPDMLRVANEGASAENLEGGFQWTSELRFMDNCYLLGLYIPIDALVGSKGTMFAVVSRNGRAIRGIWAGCNVDSELTSGRFVFSRSREDLIHHMARELAIDESTIVLG